MTPRPFEDWWADVQVAVERIGRAELAALVRSTAAREMGREVYAERVWDALEVAALRASVEARKRHRAYTHTPVTQSPVREILAVVPESDLHAFQTRLAEYMHALRDLVERIRRRSVSFEEAQQLLAVDPPPAPSRARYREQQEADRQLGHRAHAAVDAYMRWAQERNGVVGGRAGRRASNLRSIAIRLESGRANDGDRQEATRAMLEMDQLMARPAEPAPEVEQDPDDIDAWVESIVGKPWRPDRYSQPQVAKLERAVVELQHPWLKRWWESSKATDEVIREAMGVKAYEWFTRSSPYGSYNEFARRRAFPNFLKAGWRPSKAELHAALNPEKVRGLVRQYIEHVRDDELRALELWRNPVLWAEGSTPEQRIDALRPLYEVTEIQRIYRYLEWAGLAGPIGDPFQRTYDDQTDLVDLLKGRVSYLDAQLKTKRAKDAAAERDRERWRR